MKTKENLKKGISLIVLVITIIVIIILSTMVVVTILDNNPIASAIRAVDSMKIADYTERINLIVAKEIMQRLETPKEELLIKSLKNRIKEESWVQEVFMTDDNGIEKTDATEGTHLIVETKDGYELIVEVDNVGLIAEVVNSGKVGKEKYEVTYIEDGKREKVEVRCGFSITLKECKTIKNGYKFTGWCESEKGDKERYASLSLYKPTKNTELYAIFEQMTVTIDFNANGGEGKLEDITLKPGQETQLPSNNEIIRKGYNFKGWNTKQDGSGIFYSDNATIITTENITLYAIWEENITATVSITNKKFTEGTTIDLGAIAGNNIQKVELKAGNIVLYTEDNIGLTTYNKNNIQLEELNNLSQLPFYEDITVTLEITTESKAQYSANLNNVKNYTVSTARQLTDLANIVNNNNTLDGETIIQLADFDVNPGMWTKNADQTVTFKSGATQWPVIGSSDYNSVENTIQNKRVFKGIFDGKGHEIRGVYINNVSKDIAGLFGCNEGTIKNVTLENSTVNGRYQVGGIVAGNDGNIENCINKASVTGTRSVGGICGWSNTQLSNNVNYGKISNAYNSNWQQKFIEIGGITGYAHGNILECGNYGEVNFSGIAEEHVGVGGIVGVVRK